MKDPGQILLINDFGYVNGGISRVAFDSAGALAAQGYDVTFFSAVAGTAELERPGLKLKSTGQRKFLGDPNRLRGLTRAFWNRPAEHAVDALAASLDPKESVVHVHSWSQANSASIFAPLLRRKLRLVVSLHDYFIACPNGAFTDFPKAESCDVVPLSGACWKKDCDARSRSHKILKFGRQWVQKRFAKAPRSVRNFIAVSPFLQRILQSHLPPDSRLFLLPNPVDLVKPAPADVESNREWTFAGQLAPHKGVRLFAKAAARLKLNATFIGQGEEAEAIRNIYPAARLTGWLERGPLLSTLAKSRGLVFPSIGLESQSLVVTEALALGIPVVVSSGTAGAEAVIDGETGLIFKKNDLEDLIRKMRRLEEDPALRVKMGRQAFERYWNNPSTLKKHLDGLLEIYRTIE